MSLRQKQPATKWLGVYLLIIGLYHVGFYTLTLVKPEDWPPLYLEPRFYSDMFLFGRIGEQGVFALGVAIGIWLALLGLLLIVGRRPLIAYIASEVLFSLTSLPVLGIYLVLGIVGGGHFIPGFLVQCAFLLGFVIITLVPLFWAVRIWRQQRASREPAQPAVP